MSKKEDSLNRYFYKTKYLKEDKSPLTSKEACEEERKSYLWTSYDSPEIANSAMIIKNKQGITNFNKVMRTNLSR